MNYKKAMQRNVPHRLLWLPSSPR